MVESATPIISSRLPSLSVGMRLGHELMLTFGARATVVGLTHMGKDVHPSRVLTYCNSRASRSWYLLHEVLSNVELPIKVHERLSLFMMNHIFTYAS